MPLAKARAVPESLFSMSTIYQVAEAAHVSPKTAARILAGDSKRSKHRERVLAAAAKLGYVRNQQAANLRSGTSQVIGIVVPDINKPHLRGNYPDHARTLAWRRGSPSCSHAASAIPRTS